MNRIHKVANWILQKALGFPAWNLSSSPGQAYQEFFRGGDDTMRRISTVWTCSNLLGRVCSTLPADIVQSDGNISKPVSNYIGDLLNQPNEYMNKVVFFETMFLSLNTRGAAFAEIVRVGNRITALWPLPYERVKPIWANRDLVYDVSLPNGAIKRFQSRDILRVINFSFDGVTGLTPLQLHAVRRGVAASDFQENLFRNGARPSIAFSSAEKPTDEAQKRARETAERLYTGPENAGRMLFLWGGMTASTLSISPADAQLLQTLEMSMAEIAAAYGVPLNFLNQTDKTATYASAEQFNRYFVDYTIGPLCVRFAAALTDSLLNPRLGLSVKFNLDALLAGDSMGRANYLRTLVAAGIMTPNESRAKLNLPPLPGGDELITQSNQAPLAMLGNLAEGPTSPAPDAQALQKADIGIDWRSISRAVDDVRWKASTQ